MARRVRARRHATGDRQAAQCRNREGVKSARCPRKARGARRRDRRRFAGRVLGAGQVRSREVGGRRQEVRRESRLTCSSRTRGEMNVQRWLSSLVVAVVLVAAGDDGAAQAYPTKSIRLVAPSTPGDAPDVIARLVAERLSVALGQQVVVENRPGAGGVVGSEIVAKAAPDGYTLIMGNAGSHGINAAVYSKLPYDILKDFT